MRLGRSRGYQNKGTVAGGEKEEKIQKRPNFRKKKGLDESVSKKRGKGGRKCPQRGEKEKTTTEDEENCGHFRKCKRECSRFRAIRKEGKGNWPGREGTFCRRKDHPAVRRGKKRLSAFNRGKGNPEKKERFVHDEDGRGNFPKPRCEERR